MNGWSRPSDHGDIEAENTEMRAGQFAEGMSWPPAEEAPVSSNFFSPDFPIEDVEVEAWRLYSAGADAIEKAILASFIGGPISTIPFTFSPTKLRKGARKAELRRRGLR